MLRWELPQSYNLPVTLGRSLGILISIIAIFAFLAIRMPVANPFYFDMLLVMFLGMTILQAFGALRKAQPITATIEII